MSHMLGQTVRLFRKEAGVKQAELAAEAGWYPSALNRLEMKGRWPADPSELERLLNVVASRSTRPNVNRASDVWLAAVYALKGLEDRHADG
jgi:transcriptional regulator with XRE-family HTH domain